MIGIQDIAAAATVGVAIMFLVRRVYRLVTQTQSTDCGGCDRRGVANTKPLVEIELPKRDSNS